MPGAAEFFVGTEAYSILLSYATPKTHLHHTFQMYSPLTELVLLQII